MERGGNRWKPGKSSLACLAKDMVPASFASVRQSLSASKLVIILESQAINICAGAALLWRISKGINLEETRGRKNILL